VTGRRAKHDSKGGRADGKDSNGDHVVFPIGAEQEGGQVPAPGRNFKTSKSIAG